MLLKLLLDTYVSLDTNNGSKIHYLCCQEASWRSVNIVKILPKGEKLLENLLPSYYKSVDDICSVFNAKEKKLLGDLLTRLRNRTKDVKV